MRHRTLVAEPDNLDSVDHMRSAEGTLEAGVGCIRAGGAGSLVGDVAGVEEREEARNLAVEHGEYSRENLDKVPAEADCIRVEVSL